MTEWVSLETGAHAALALPDGRPRGAVVVAGEMFGVTDYVIGVVERLAAAGYVAAAPDFYWRSGRRLALDYDEAGRQRGLALLGEVTVENVVADVAAARSLAGKHADGGGGCAMLGFSAGGHFAVLAGVAMPFDLVVTAYGAWTLHGDGPIREPHPPLDDAEALAGSGTEVLGFVGDQDHVIGRDEWAGIERRLTEAGVIHELVTYPGRPHGFLCPDRPATYDAEATDDVWRRILDGLDRRVGAP